MSFHLDEFEYDEDQPCPVCGADALVFMGVLYCTRCMDSDIPDFEMDGCGIHDIIDLDD